MFDGSHWPLAAFILAILAWIGREGIGVWIKYRDQKLKEKAASHEHKKSSDEVLISRLVVDLEAVRAALVHVQTDHLECVKATGLLEGKCAALETLNYAQQDRLAKMDKEIESLREWRHTVANQEHVEGIQHKIEEKLQSGAIPIVRKDAP